MNRLPYFITQSIVRYDKLTSDESIFFFLDFFLEKTAFDLLFFVHYSVTQLRYFWWNHVLNNFSLLNGFLTLVCLLIVHSYFIIMSEYRYIFWSLMFFSNSSYIASHEAPINCFFWLSVIVFFFRLMYLLTQFLSALTLESSVIY